EPLVPGAVVAREPHSSAERRAMHPLCPECALPVPEFAPHRSKYLSTAGKSITRGAGQLGGRGVDNVSKAFNGFNSRHRKCHRPVHVTLQLYKHNTIISKKLPRVSESTIEKGDSVITVAFPGGCTALSTKFTAA